MQFRIDTLEAKPTKGRGKITPTEQAELNKLQRKLPTEQGKLNTY